MRAHRGERRGWVIYGPRRVGDIRAISMPADLPKKKLVIVIMVCNDSQITSILFLYIWLPLRLRPYKSYQRHTERQHGKTLKHL